MMQYRALASDYDGTLATEGTVSEETVRALRRLKERGWKLLLVTGRLLEDLISLFPRLDLFDCIVAENGAVLYQPGLAQTRALGTAPPDKFLDELRDFHVTPLTAGHVIVATCEPHQAVVLETIHRLGLELQVIFNKGAVMILPTGVNKASGLQAALHDLQLLPAEVVGVGDGENDHALLEYCGYAAAVRNAVPALKQHADWVSPSPAGAGVAELIDKLLRDEPVAKTPAEPTTEPDI